ncbi:hypothetical protein HUJ05_009629 [Dendroctonus ponderosae]|nr:hypothetical protein HUJ05_009629 [Dendroctonus ponderosae]
MTSLKGLCVLALVALCAVSFSQAREISRQRREAEAAKKLQLPSTIMVAVLNGARVVVIITMLITTITMEAKATTITVVIIIMKRATKGIMTKGTITIIMESMADTRSTIIMTKDTMVITITAKRERKDITSVKRDITKRATIPMEVTINIILTNSRKKNTSSTKIMMAVIMRNMEGSTMNMDTKREVTTRDTIIREATIMIITDIRSIIITEDTIMKTVDTKDMEDTSIITIITMIMARREVMITISTGDTRKAASTKLEELLTGRFQSAHDDVLVISKGPEQEKEIFMYDLTTNNVSKLSGELSSAFVEAAEANSSDDLSNGQAAKSSETTANQKAH